ncbi:Thiamin pyrophosphokinase [Pediococcus damnosus]|uniref:Thiamine diphosphokinase n=1 Tax=Pediococcus damnosus TaxID=51663 RepID=A0A0R2H9D9_9LACO|nr:thiamine diphosphokinase [Pediococcus damnosus]AMV61430.1 Thiamin pyrophosphokinase [Pediococcus damnosus]AMV62212.1 Thiamin pyrophosphokinase [Pediococcus damnosus]AMV65793.1 Thiamin pyrophosphokinase [Pediococcus damnosus]AMV67931.1 Thiamin pyrophosphokinase [Pediococcus damnosus]AMV70130.1 Thiamin pyrophosphokinase [Pediococcus damnosus]
MQVNILAGGPRQQYPENLFNQKAGWIGVDRGALILIKNHIRPQLAVGDFDSMTVQELVEVKKNCSEIIQVNPVKDDTDTELALASAFEQLHADEVHLYGATGGRLDHLLSNIFMLLKPKFNQYVEQVKIIDRQNCIYFFNAGQHCINVLPDYKYLSFVSLGKVENLTLPDEKYQLHNQSDQLPVAYVSNEFLKSTASFSFSSGTVAVIYSHDAN